MNQESIQRNIDILEAKENPSDKEIKKLNKLKGKIEKEKAFDIGKYKNVIYTILGVGGVIAVVAGLGWYIFSQPFLPPSSSQGHNESSPRAHILTEPIPDAVQRHMIEHSDGAGLPGIIIQYNCEDYDCEGDLVTNLTNLASEYPDNVYLAPGEYDGKIILTRQGQIEILENFDEEAIKDFIN